MKKLILTLFPLIISAQYTGKVGINTPEPTNTLDINGDLRIRNILNSEVASNTYILIIDENNVVKKVLLSNIITPPTNNSCPQFIVEGSIPYYLRFKGGGYISNPNDPIKVNGLTFNGAGSWFENNVTYYTYTNVSGTALDTSSFSVLFDSHTCNY